MIGTNETYFPNKLLLNDKQVLKFCQVFANNSLVIIKLAKTQLSKIVWSERFLGRLIEPLMKVGLLLMKNVCSYH